MIDEFTGETEFTQVAVEVEDGGPDEWPTIGITLSPAHGLPLPGVSDERCLMVSMDEARLIIAGLAAVLR